MLTTTTLMVTKDGWRAQVTYPVTNPQETKAVLMSLLEPASDYYLASSDGDMEGANPHRVTEYPFYHTEDCRHDTRAGHHIACIQYLVRRGSGT